MKRADLAALALIVLAMVRIASTWTVFSATNDEPMHVSAGLELFSQHRYTYHALNPPLPRVVIAFAPWLGGMQFDPSLPVGDQLKRVFYSGRGYATNLVLARCGNLVFFLIGAVATWLWARRSLGPAGGALAALLFTTQPMILGHAGLATSDMAMCAGFALALFAFVRWIEEPRASSAMAFGAALGFAIACKLPSALYVPAACAALYGVRLAWSHDARSMAPRVGRGVIAMLFAAAAAFILGYGGRLDWMKTALQLSIETDRSVTFSFLAGEISTKGWWWYFPAAVAWKTTLGSLLLALLALIRRSPVAAECVAAAGAVLVVAMPTPLDVGVRYVLPVYAPLSIAAAAALLTPLRRSWRIVAVGLLSWHLIASALTHPDAFAYFNEAAGREPWRLLIDSNIDWGQDVLRLREVVREKHIDQLGLAVMGWHDYDALGFPPHYDVLAQVPTQGWVAVSEHYYGIRGGIAWLRGRPYERVGRSIRLYYVP